MFDSENFFPTLCWPQESPLPWRERMKARGSHIVFPICFVFSLLFLTVIASQAAVLSTDLQSALQSRSSRKEIPIIVNLSDKVDLSQIREADRHLKRLKMINALKEKADLTQGPLKALLESRGSKRIIPLWIKNAIAVTVPRTLISEMESLPEVESIELDAVIQASVSSFGTAALPEWNLTAIKAPDLWNLGYTGAGVVVANMDTGVDMDHPDLKTGWRGGTNSWFNPFSDPANSAYCANPNQCTPCELSSNTPCDRDGHGTGTMGVMVGGSAGGTAIGVAPDAQWVAVKIFNDSNPPITTISIIHQGFQWILNPDGDLATKDAPDIVNASWGLEAINECDSTFVPDIEALEAAGIAVVFAAGNYGPNPSSSISPANNLGAFAAGALDDSLNIASFSSRGPSACDGSIFPHVVAPGVNIKTSALTGGGIFPDSYVYISGTSFSAPHVAGGMALLLSAFPNATVSEMEWVLEQSALDLGSLGPDNNYGFGLLDALEAYQLLLNGVTISVSPSSHDFDSVKEGDISSPRIFAVTNLTSKDIGVDTASMTGLNAVDFIKQSDTCSGQSIPPSGNCIVQVVFSPTSGGPKNANLSISLTDPNVSPSNVALRGMGIEQSSLIITKTGTGAGNVISIPIGAGIDCGADCSNRYTPGAKVTLKAIPDTDSTIGGWSGCDRIQEGKCKIGMNGDKTVTARFIGPSLTVTFPNGGETWKPGTYRKIKWTYTGRPGGYVKIELLQGDTVVKRIAEKAPRGTNGFGHYIWFIPRKLPEGNNYSIRITSTRNSSYTDASDAPFILGH